MSTETVSEFLAEQKRAVMTFIEVVPDEPGVYVDAWGNIWRKYGDGVFVMPTDPDAQPERYAPFTRMVAIDAPTEWECAWRLPEDAPFVPEPPDQDQQDRSGQ